NPGKTSLEVFDIATGDCDAGATARQSHRHRQTKTAATTGDECDLPFQCVRRQHWPVCRRRPAQSHTTTPSNFSIRNDQCSASIDETCPVVPSDEPPSTTSECPVI